MDYRPLQARRIENNKAVWPAAIAAVQGVAAVIQKYIEEEIEEQEEETRRRRRERKRQFRKRSEEKQVDRFKKAVKQKQ